MFTFCQLVRKESEERDEKGMKVMDKEVQSKCFELLNMDRYLLSSFIKNEKKSCWLFTSFDIIPCISSE